MKLYVQGNHFQYKHNWVFSNIVVAEHAPFQSGCIQLTFIVQLIVELYDCIIQ